MEGRRSTLPPPEVGAQISPWFPPRGGGARLFSSLPPAKVAPN